MDAQDHDDGEQAEAGAAAVPTGGRLHRHTGGRQHVVFVRLTGRELGVIEARAAAAGVSKQRFMVECATHGEWAPAERHAFYKVLGRVRNVTYAVGNNLNQIARVANTTGQVLPGYETTAKAVQDAMAALEGVLAKLPAEGWE